MQIDHVAHVCGDPRATHQFYTSVLGLQLVAAYAGQDLMLVYALPDGGSIVFSTGARSRLEHDDSDWEHQHVGLTVSTRAEFENWLHRLWQCGIRHRLVDGERVYFSDPDGVALELEVASPTRIDPTASDVLQRWLDNSR